MALGLTFTFWAELPLVASPVAVIIGEEADQREQQRLAALKERAAGLQVFAIPGAAGDLVPPPGLTVRPVAEGDRGTSGLWPRLCRSNLRGARDAGHRQLGYPCLRG